jgi:hypothetical protein
MEARRQTWLSELPWDLVVFQNASLCQQKNALHKPTSDGYQTTKNLWESRHCEPMTLFEVVELCRKCHRMAPFCFYNGNTFASIARLLIAGMNLAPVQTATIRSLAGHIVAGVATDEEVKAFKAFSDSYAG